MQTNDNEIAVIVLGLTLLFGVLVVLIIIILLASQARLRKKQAESFRNILDAQEKERERIARDLHDQVGPLLSKLKLSFDVNDERSIVNDWQNFRTSSRKLIDEAVTDIRNTSYDLMPKVLYTDGLIPALEDFCELMSRGLPVEIHFAHSGPAEQMSRQAELSLYRIVQELLNNAIKYAGAKNIYVDLATNAQLVTLHVKDDGSGFDLEKKITEKSSSRGLHNMRSRTALLGGTVKMHSKPGEGTSYQFTFKTSHLL